MNALNQWQKGLEESCYGGLDHTLSFYLSEQAAKLGPELKAFAQTVVRDIVPLVHENNRPENLPCLERYDAFGQASNKVIHHPSYETIGNLIYGTKLMERVSKPGGLLEGLLFFFLSSHAGEAGHNCPIACSAGVLRLIEKVNNFPDKRFYYEKLIKPSFTHNFTGAQFVTEIQGGSDAGENTTRAYQDEHGEWRIEGEKWFCSNANADVILMTARFDPSIPGTKGLGLFFVPDRLEDNRPNGYTIKRLKDKLGTRSMATGEIEFHGAKAYPLGRLDEGFKLLMENVLHISRLFNTFTTLGMARRAYQIASSYAEHRVAFGKPIAAYPLVRESLAAIEAEGYMLLASICRTIQLQDAFDLKKEEDASQKLLLRLLANLNKYISALKSVEHIHHCLDVLAGNGTIETFSSIPLLLRDSLICENWEGTHNVLRMQILRDIYKYNVDEIFLDYLRENLGGDSRLKLAYDKLALDFASLKALDPEDAAYAIKSVVDQMAYLFALNQLFLEASDQLKKGSDLKMKAYENAISSAVNAFSPRGGGRTFNP